MIRSNTKKLILILSSLTLLIVIGYFTTFKKVQKREISSVDSHEDAVHSLSLNWQETDRGVIVRITSSDGELCENWTSLKVIFKAEGLAYSGEVDRVAQKTGCENNQFQQTWIPNLTEIEGEEFQKLGVFGEEPPLWVMEQILLSGPKGQQVLTSAEIQQLYGSIPTLTPN